MTFNYLKKINNFKKSAISFILVIKKIDLYIEIAKENIGYNKLLQDVKYKKLVENTQKKYNSREKKTCYTNMASIILIDPQVLEDIGSQEDILISSI